MNLPKFMIRQTGGVAVGAISTRSSAASRAFWRASCMATTPRGSPSAPIRRTSFHRICSLTRMFFLSIFHLRNQFLTALRHGHPCGSGEFEERHGSAFGAVAQADRDGARRGLLLADDEHRGDLLQLRAPDPGAELFVAIVRLDAQALGGERRGDAPGG